MAAQRVMIVEDDPHFGGQLADLFEFQGYSVDLLPNGEDALETFCQRPPCVVILDIVLPGIGGVDLARKIRESEVGGEVPIFLMSAVYRDPRMFERELRQLSIVEFLAKPFSPIDLGRKVDALLDSDVELQDAQARVTNTGSWRLTELEAALGEGAAQLGAQASFDRRSLLDTFLELFRRHSAGRLSLTDGIVQRDIYFLNGYPVAATSSEDSESLVAVLAEMGLLPRSDGDDAVRLADLQGLGLRDVILSRALVPERKLRRAERASVKRIVLGCFDWATGSYEFEPGGEVLLGRSVTEVNPVSCLSEVVMRSISLVELSPDIEPRMLQVLSKGSRYGSLVSYITLPEGLQGLLDCLEGEHRVQDVFERFDSEREALTRVLWLMLSLGIIEATGRGLAEAAGRGLAEAAGQALPAAAPSDFSFVEQHHRVQLNFDYYAFLGVERSAKDDELELARRKLAVLYAGPADDPAVEEQLKALRTRLKVSFETLSDPSERQQYDQRLGALETGEWTWPISQD
jgi:DNA-binding response OmpR family regulator